MKRALWFFVGLFSIFFLPWYLTLIILIGGFFYFSDYYEGIALGLIYDSLYFIASSGPSIPWWFFGSIILFFLIYFIKPSLRRHV